MLITNNLIFLFSDVKRNIKSMLNYSDRLYVFESQLNKSSEFSKFNCESHEKGLEDVKCVYSIQQHNSIYRNELTMNLYEIFSNIETVLTHSCDSEVLSWHIQNKNESFVRLDNVSVQFYENFRWRNLSILNVTSSSGALEITFELDENFRKNETNILNLRFNNQSEFAIYDHKSECRRIIKDWPKFSGIFCSLILLILGILITFGK